MKRLDQLTFTRFIALLLVLVYHGAGGIYMKWFDHFPITPLLRSAPTAVSYLYVLSGFVMSLVYFRPKEKFDVPTYWSARIVRIYPLYIISFALTCLYYIDGIARIKPRKILANIFVVQAWYPDFAQSFNYASWSMTVEFFFYAVFPFFVMRAYKRSTKTLIWTSLAIWIVSQTAHFVLWKKYFPEWEMFVVYFPLFHLNSFIMGVVGGIWYLREGQNEKLSAKTIWAVLGGSVIFTSLFTIAGSLYPQIPHDLQPMSGMLAPLFVVTIVALAMDRTKLSSILSHPVLVTLGETAFALYILHVPVIWLFKRALENFSVKDPGLVLDYTYLPLMLLVGLIAHFYVDRPVRNWMKKIMQRISMPLLLLDLAILSLSIYYSFIWRFGEGREYNSYKSTTLIMFWSAFFLRTILSVWLKALDPKILHGSWLDFIKPVALSATSGTLVVGAIVYAVFANGLIYNFPRSIFALDWILVLGASLFVRLVFRLAGFYKPALAPAR